jgi:hypothetical protein
MFSELILEIFYQARSEISIDDFVVSVDNQTVDYQIHQDRLTLAVALGPGVHVLKIASCTSKRVNFSEVQLDRASVRHLLYLSYLQNSDTVIQPCTELWDTHQTWVLPFGNPMSFWIECALDRLPQDVYGKDLQQLYNIWYPTAKIDLPPAFSTAVRDFFKYNFGFTARSKVQDSLRTWPCVPLNLDLTNTHLVVDEFRSLRSTFDQENKISKNQKQNQYNALESELWSPDRWHFTSFYRYNEQTKQYYYPVDPALVPVLWDQIQKWDIRDFVRVNIICLEPGGYASPHKDADVISESGNSNYEGCCQFYIPLDFPNNNYIKLAGAGIVDTTRANAINITDFTHSAVNNSDQTRYVMIIRCNIESNLHLVDQSIQSMHLQ